MHSSFIRRKVNMDTLTQIFWNDGLKFAKQISEHSALIGHRKFKTFYGISPEVFACLWTLMREKPEGSEPKHMLWCMFFLKNYNKEHVNAAYANVDEKTFRLWTWRFIELLSKLKVVYTEKINPISCICFKYVILPEQVKWENRLKSSEHLKMRVSLDGTDCKIREPQPFNKKWYSHKFKAPGIRYEIGISIIEGDIVWASGGLPCGEWTDLKIALDLYVHVAKNEMTLADKGYRQKKYFKQPTNAMEKRILARHETLNGRLKEFGILDQKFRHPLHKHPLVFHAVVNVVQASIMMGEKLFDL